jgi:hypothetical protein
MMIRMMIATVVEQALRSAMASRIIRKIIVF